MPPLALVDEEHANSTFTSSLRTSQVCIGTQAFCEDHQKLGRIANPTAAAAAAAAQEKRKVAQESAKIQMKAFQRVSDSFIAHRERAHKETRRGALREIWPEGDDASSDPVTVSFSVCAWSSQVPLDDCVTRISSYKSARTIAKRLTSCSTGWQSNCSGPQWLVLDLQRPAEVTGIRLRSKLLSEREGVNEAFRVSACALSPRSLRSSRDTEMQIGVECSPKDVQVMRADFAEGPWVYVKRAALPYLSRIDSTADSDDDEGTPLVALLTLPGEALHEVAFDGGRAAQYWRLVFNEPWIENGCLSVPAIEVIAMPERATQLTDNDPDLQLSAPIKHFPVDPHRRSLTTLFSEQTNLNMNERELRELARQHDIPLDYAETIRKLFGRYDLTEDGHLDLNEFHQAVDELFTSSFETFTDLHEDRQKAQRELLALRMRTRRCQRQTTSYARTEEVNRVPSKTVLMMWREIDRNGNGLIELGEFMVWFYSKFHPKHTEAKTSWHSERAASTVCEHYYADFGRNRLRRDDRP